ncbi:MAG: hypothetical protein J6I73_10045 [Treponema sp.]|nr:hypothetical protein [Treponema sp.]
MKKRDTNFLSIFTLIMIVSIPFSLRFSFLFSSHSIGTIILSTIYSGFGFLYYCKYSNFFKKTLNLKEILEIFLKLFFILLIGTIGLFIFLSFSDKIIGRIILLGGSILLGLLSVGFFLAMIIHQIIDKIKKSYTDHMKNQE